MWKGEGKEKMNSSPLLPSFPLKFTLYFSHLAALSSLVHNFTCYTRGNSPTLDSALYVFGGCCLINILCQGNQSQKDSLKRCLVHSRSSNSRVINCVVVQSYTSWQDRAVKRGSATHLLLIGRRRVRWQVRRGRSPLCNGIGRTSLVLL